LAADRRAGRSQPLEKKCAKSLSFLPMAISFVGASIIWNFIYEYRPAWTNPDRPAERFCNGFGGRLRPGRNGWL
jgi:hypothetical protein